MCQENDQAKLLVRNWYKALVCLRVEGEIQHAETTWKGIYTIEKKKFLLGCYSPSCALAKP